jgi:peptide/nickel transport system substrate-binding protein
MKHFVTGSIIPLLVTLGWTEYGWGEKHLNFPLLQLYHWVSITWNVMEHLIEHDKEGQFVPRLATGWRWRDDRTLELALRHGVRFHNGEVFDAEIVQLNWDENIRLHQPHVTGPFLNFTPGTRLEILDPYTVRLVFPEPDGGALVKLSILHIANRQFYRDLGWGEKHW